MGLRSPWRTGWPVRPAGFSGFRGSSNADRASEVAALGFCERARKAPVRPGWRARRACTAESTEGGPPNSAASTEPPTSSDSPDRAATRRRPGGNRLLTTIALAALAALAGLVVGILLADGSDPESASSDKGLSEPLDSTPSDTADNDGEMSHFAARGAIVRSREGPVITAGYRHTCALRDDGAARCWGNNDDGQTSPPSNHAA